MWQAFFMALQIAITLYVSLVAVVNRAWNTGADSLFCPGGYAAKAIDIRLPDTILSPRKGG